jgi:hypothetical protein
MASATSSSDPGGCGKKLENRSSILVSRDSDLTEGFRAVKVWNQFPNFSVVFFVSGLEFFRIEWGVS